MAQQTLTDYDRLEISFKRNLVREVLPEYFAGEYPNIITFLEGYYDFLDSADNFGDMINDLYTIRDIEASSLLHLDNMFKEYALGMSQDFFKKPREILRNFARFFRVKGSKYSAEGFFRGFFGEDIEVSYPKTDIFTLNDSSHEIGSHSVSVLQDGEAFQILSIMIKSPLSFNRWGELYKKFVHPVGFFLSNEVLITAQNVSTFSALGAIFDSTKGADLPLLVFDEITGVIANPFADTTIMELMGATSYILDGAGREVDFPTTNGTYTALRTPAFGLNDSTISYTSHDPGSNTVFNVRLDPDETIRKYKDFSVDSLDTTYASLFEIGKASSPKFDRDSVDGATIRMSNTIERFDEATYDSH